MSFKQKLKDEMKAIGVAALYFGCWIGALLFLEKGFEGRHEYGGFGPALRQLIQQTDFHHVLANTLCLSGALLGYNMLFVVQRHLGEGSIIRIFMSPIPDKPENDP